MPEEALTTRLVGMVLDDAVWPFLQLWLEIVARGGRGDPIFRTTGERIAAGFLDWVAAQSDAPTEAARREIAARQAELPCLQVADRSSRSAALGLAVAPVFAWRAVRARSNESGLWRLLQHRCRREIAKFRIRPTLATKLHCWRF